MSDDSPAAADPLAALREELLALTPADLARHAGKPGYRWAWQFVQDLDLERGFRISGERHLVLSFMQPRLAFRCMGGGLDNLIADADIAQLAKYRVAAVLALRRAVGAGIAPPEPAATPRTASLDLGKDHALAEAAELSIDESRRRLRASASQLFADCIELGLAHLSQGMQERFATLAVWAQGADYPRLALLLRRLADHVELLLDRAGGADEHRLLDELAIANALVAALEAAASRGAAPEHLVGRARSRYSETGTLELLGLGAHPWRSAAGYVGLTMVFWSPKDGAFMSCSDARPENQRSFNPVARYKAAGPWSGLGAPAQATGRRLSLAGAQLNAGGRLSSSESTTATVTAAPSADEFIASLPVARSWAELLQCTGGQGRSLLAEPQPMRDWCVVQPASFGTPVFDATRQTLLWPLLDAQGETLQAELVFDAYTRHAIDRIERFQKDGPPAGSLVVGRLRPGAAGTTLEPLSLVRPGTPAVDALHFDEAPDGGFVSQRMQAATVEALAAPDHAVAPSAIAMPLVLREHRHWLCRQAERGCAAEQAPRVLAEAAAWSEKLSAAGFGACARLLPQTKSAAALLLRSHYLGMQYERLLDCAEEAAG